MDEIPKSEHEKIKGRWQSFDCNGLSIPPIQPNTMITYYKSLVGKELRAVVQAAPFVLFEFLTPEKRRIWTLLCHLCSYALQTKITNVPKYEENLTKIVNRFLFELISSNARWSNKPKFHMLLHLVDSIRRFGPSSLCATEKFESFNGAVRAASVHSNRQSPSRDIAITFMNLRLLRMILSGSTFKDRKSNLRRTAGSEVLKVFDNNPVIQQMLGWDKDWGQVHELTAHCKHSPFHILFLQIILGFQICLLIK